MYEVVFSIKMFVIILKFFRNEKKMANFLYEDFLYRVVVRMYLSATSDIPPNLTWTKTSFWRAGLKCRTYNELLLAARPLVHRGVCLEEAAGKDLWFWQRWLEKSFGVGNGGSQNTSGCTKRWRHCTINITFNFSFRFWKISCYVTKYYYTLTSNCVHMSLRSQRSIGFISYIFFITSSHLRGLRNIIMLLRYSIHSVCLVL